MSNPFQSSPASASAPVHVAPANAGWSSDFDDVAFGCECADPCLQIDCWGQENTEPMQAGGASS